MASAAGGLSASAAPTELVYDFWGFAPKYYDVRYDAPVAPELAASVERLLAGHHPVRREEFTATRGQGAQRNGRRIRVSTRTGLKEAVLGTGIPFCEPSIRHLPAYLQTLEQFASQTAGIRRAGAAALDLAYVAAGRLDGFWEIGLQPWDIAAGALLVQEAGGLISDFDGGNEWMESGRIVAANPKCLKAMLQVIRPTLGSAAAP